MLRSCIRSRGSTAALALFLLLGGSTVSQAQQAKVSIGVFPFGAKRTSPLFKIEIVEPPARRGLSFPSLTLIDTSTGPRLTRVGLTLPAMTLGNTAVASQFGDQSLPRTFVSSPLAGASVKRPIRGLSLSTVGATPWSFSVGQLDTGTSTLAPSPDGPGLMALSVGLTPRQRFSVAPRLLVPVASQPAQTSVGTAIQAQLSPNISFVSDVGAADGAKAGWDPLASTGVIAHWAGAEVETNVLRGAPSLGSQSAATIGSTDREVVRAQFRSIPGTTISGLANWSRPASASRAADTKVGSIGVAYNRLRYGQLLATSQSEASASQQTGTTLVEWRQAPAGGFAVRYVDKRQTYQSAPEQTALWKQVEVDLPGWKTQNSATRTRVDVHTAFTADPAFASPTLSSRLTGRFDVFGAIGLAGETELGVTATAGQRLLRALRLISEVPLFNDTAVQVLYTYRGGMPFVFDQAIEARISRTIQLFRR
jgi:hypothetical protein